MRAALVGAAAALEDEVLAALPPAVEAAWLVAEEAALLEVPLDEPPV